MSKKRFLAGIMSLLLIITSVFTGNVVTVRAAESAIDSSSYTGGRYVVSGDDAPESFESVLIPDGCCFRVEKAITVNGAITVNPGGRLEVVGDGNITCGSLSVGESAEGKDPSLYFDGTSNVPKIGDTALDLYELTDDGFSKIQDVQWSEFIYDYTASKWVWFNPYDAFGPTEEYPTIVEVELRGYTRSGEESFPISFESVDEKNTLNGWDRMKARVRGNSLTISWDADAEVKPLQICVEGAGENNDWLIEDVRGDQNSYTINLLEENKDHYLVQVKYQLDQDSDGGRITYGKDGILEFNIENYDKGDVSFRIGEGPRYRVGGTEDVPEEKMQDALKDTTLEAGNTMKVWAGAYGGKIVGNFDIRIDGESVFSTDDERTSARTEAESTEGYTFTVPTGYESTKRIELAIEFRDEASGGSNGVNCYGKDDKLAFNIANSDKGNVFFQVGEVKYRVGGDDQYSESAIRDTLKTKEFAVAETITIWAENGEGVNIGNFDIRIEGNSVFNDEARDAAKNAAQGESGYAFSVPEGYTSDKQIEFQIEFLTEESGGGDNDVTYDADTTISNNLTMNDVTVHAGILTIDGCSLRVDHELVVESGATIVGTSASSKLVLAGDAFSNGIELYYGDEKISDDKNNYFSNNGDGPIEFNWDTASTRWVTEQQPAEGGGEAPWYTVSYGKSANLSTKNGKVYAERVHIGDITYSSIASEYNASEDDKIYSMADTIFRQKTKEEENNPESGYVDPLVAYGIGGSDGDIFIRKDVSDVSIDFKFIPDFGYQLTNIYTNENETDSLLNEFTAAEAVSSFKFEVKQGGNVHFEVKFEEVDNKVTGNAGIASSAKIASTNAAASGTLEMKVDNATASNAIPSGSEALAAYDITLANVVSKGGDRGSWDTPLEDLGENVATVTLPVKDTTNYTYTVIREHAEENPVTLNATVTDGAISFDTNKFSKYTIVKTPVAKSSIEKAEITLGDALTYNGEIQTQTVSSVKIGDTVLNPSTDYTVSGNEKKDAGTYTLTITGTGNYTGTATKEFTISKAAPTITLSNLSETTQAPSGVKATISPEDAAAVVIEYQVEVSANGQTTKQWVKTRPAIAGTYPVRAYLPEGTTNLEAVRDANAVTGTYILTQYTASTGSSGGSTGSSSGSTQTETKPDGTIVETGTETKADGTKVDTTVEKKTDGTKTETVVETAKDGSVKTTETVTLADGSSTKTEKETETNAAGKEVAVTTTTEKDTAGIVTGSTEISVIEKATGSTSATVTVVKDADGKITEAEAQVDKKGSRSKSGVTGSLFGTVVSQITEAAGTNSVEVEMTVTAGKKSYTVKADTADLEAGNKLKVMAVDSKTGDYVLVNAKTYKVSDAGSVKLTLPAGQKYQLLDTKEAAVVEKAILNTVKVKKTTATVKKGKKTSVEMSSKLDMDNVAKIIYSTSKKSVATVNKNGTVTAKKAGTVTIQAKVTLNNGKTKIVTMKVKVTNSQRQ